MLLRGELLRSMLLRGAKLRLRCMLLRGVLQLRGLRLLLLAVLSAVASVGAAQFSAAA